MDFLLACFVAFFATFVFFLIGQFLVIFILIVAVASFFAIFMFNGSFLWLFSGIAIASVIWILILLCDIFFKKRETNRLSKFIVIIIFGLCMILLLQNHLAHIETTVYYQDSGKVEHKTKNYSIENL